MKHSLFVAPPLAAVRFHDEYPRQPNGDLKNPPQVFVLAWNDEFGRLVANPISFGAAAALAPEQMKQISSLLLEDRNCDDSMQVKG